MPTRDEEIQENVKKAIDLLCENGVNFSGDVVAKTVREAFAREHNTLQQSFFRSVLIPIIEEMARLHEENWTDGRNEHSGELAVKLREITKEAFLPFI
jgi:hypothetical protein